MSEKGSAFTKIKPIIRARVGAFGLYAIDWCSIPGILYGSLKLPGEISVRVRRKASGSQCGPKIKNQTNTNS